MKLILSRLLKDNFDRRIDLFKIDLMAGELGDSTRFTYQRREYVAWQNVAFRARTATP